MYEHRNYCVFSTDELDTIDFSQVHETSADTVRRSVDGTRTFVKWDGEVPPCVSALTTVEGLYTHQQMIELLSSPQWTPPFSPENPQ